MMRQEILPTTIEEEPAHEFYANLFATIPVPYLSNHNSLQFSTPLSVQRPLVSATIQDDCHDSSEGGNVVKESDFSRAYRRALSSSQNLSSLSLNASNKGYQMLSSMGWKERDGGLGRKRQGSLEPIKTQLKKGKQGLGAGKPFVARVTHLQTSKALVTKKHRRKRVKEEAEIERKREKRARIIINSNLPTEYDDILLRLL